MLSEDKVSVGFNDDIPTEPPGMGNEFYPFCIVKMLPQAVAGQEGRKRSDCQVKRNEEINKQEDWSWIEPD
jgi:hypothetical protein